MNPNNCETCDYKKCNNDKTLHCYMFKDEPDDVCYQHTGRKQSLENIIEIMLTMRDNSV